MTEGPCSQVHAKLTCGRASDVVHCMRMDGDRHPDAGPRPGSRSVSMLDDPSDVLTGQHILVAGVDIVERIALCDHPFEVQ